MYRAGSELPYVGRNHSGINSYVSGDGDIIQRIRYQKIYMYAKQVKSFPVEIDVVRNNTVAANDVRIQTFVYVFCTHL